VIDHALRAVRWAKKGVINLAPTGAEADGRKGRDQSRPASRAMPGKGVINLALRAVRWAKKGVINHAPTGVPRSMGGKGVINHAPTAAEADGRKGRDESRPYGCRGRCPERA